MNSKKLNQSTANLLDWLNTWRQPDGAYNGWVVHRFDLKRLKYIHHNPIRRYYDDINDNCSDHME